jgi:putative hydrolase of the HAD superfamily
MMNTQDYKFIKMMTFDVVGTLIDFEQGILNYYKEIECKHTAEQILKAFGDAEGQQQVESPEMPFTQMLVPISDRMAERLQLPHSQGDGLRNSIKNWPAFSDSVESLKVLKHRFRLVA